MLTKMIFDGRTYQAFWIDGKHNGGLCVSIKGRTGGKILANTSPDAKKWRDAIETALDASEGDALCRAIYRA